MLFFFFKYSDGVLWIKQQKICIHGESDFLLHWHGYPAWSGLLPVLLEDSAAGHESALLPVYLIPLVYIHGLLHIWHVLFIYVIALMLILNPIKTCVGF